MNISDEWEAPEKQPFKDFVSFTQLSRSQFIWKWIWFLISGFLFRVICVTGLRTQTAVTSTVSSMKQERGQPSSQMMLKIPSWLRSERWVTRQLHVRWRLSGCGTCRSLNCLCLDAALDRDIRSLVSQRHLPGNLPPARHCIVGWREVQADPEVQPSRRISHWLLTMWEVIYIGSEVRVESLKSNLSFYGASKAKINSK